MDDKTQIITEGVNVKHTEKYVYLGSPISEIGSMKKDLDLHAEQNFKQLNKFIMFCKNNDNMPYAYKKKVFEAVITTKLMYSCETWLCENFKQIEKIYLTAVKALLNVRRQTRNDVILVEGGFNNVKKLVNERRTKFLEKKLKDKDEPLTKVFNLCQNANTKGYKILSMTNQNREANTLEVTKVNINADTASSKLTTYKTINPNLMVHEVYHTRKDCFIPDYKRAAFTKFRTSSHYLSIERGRWSRIKADQRFCRCKKNKIENEEHVIFECDITNDLREKYEIRNYASMNELFTKHPMIKLVDFIYDVMKKFN